MSSDLKIIKKKYGEEMMRFCRDEFSSILEEEGLLSCLLLEHFEPSHSLYNDIVTNNLSSSFKMYILNLYTKNEEYFETSKTPKELMADVGYILYECKSEEDIQKFKKYYVKGEELCTFRGNRLKNCRVFFAVKKNVNEIKRKDYPNPERQDTYGTSVISIQFTKDDSHTLSIKNRYNHTVQNPDATFSNNLDNIVPGLTKSFEKYYGMKQKHINNAFEIPKYVRASDGKFYKYNYEIENVYYCPNNIIIDNFEVKTYDKEKYIVMDYFILDLQNKKIYLYNKSIGDSFVNDLQIIKGIKINITIQSKMLYITKYNYETIEIELDKENNIISYKDANLTTLDNSFLVYNKRLKHIFLPNVSTVGSRFLVNNEDLTEISLPKAELIAPFFISSNKIISKVDLPNVFGIGYFFLRNNMELTELKLPNVVFIEGNFMSINEKLNKFDAPKLKEVKYDFMSSNKELEELNLPNLLQVGRYFLAHNISLKKIYLPKVKEMGFNSLVHNKSITDYDFSSLIKATDSLLEHPFIDIKQIIIENREKAKLIKDRK